MRRNRAVLGAVAVVALAGSTLAISAASSGAAEVTHVTICHRTNSDTIPYEEITPDVSGVLDGHHRLHEDLFVWGPTLQGVAPEVGRHHPRVRYAVGHHFAGLNVTATGGFDGTTTGQDILDNHCVIPTDDPEGDPEPEPEFGSLVITKAVSGPTAGTPAAYTVHVTCDDDSVDEDLELVPGVPQTIDGILDGINCTVVEPTSSGATVTYSPVGVDDPQIGVDVFTGSPTEVTVTTRSRRSGPRT